jgi:hypothetical protein
MVELNMLMGEIDLLYRETNVELWKMIDDGANLIPLIDF